MTTDQFNKIVEERKKKITSTLQKKSEEYSREGDRLHNFHRAAAFARKQPSTMCWDFNLKHLTSIADLVDDLEVEHIQKFTQAYVDEKIGDAINYLILLEALLRERLTL